DVNIAGYTDTSGSKAYNLRLSKRRADNVEKALKADGLTATHITKEAKGEEGLAIPTADGVREPLNRRAEVVIRLVPSDSFIQ
ncbi:MAG TPA: OmpA family protein, partial [Hellea balneolensis]|nr:OmpA family protein [Hellea balneolensis]